MIKNTQLTDLIDQIQLIKSPSDIQSQNPQHIIVESQYFFCSGQQNKNNAKENKIISNNRSNLNQWLPKTIAFCYFANLKQLIMNSSQIDNVQWTAFLNAPKLKVLIIATNQITNFKSFTKLNLPQLEIMNIQQNHAPQILLEKMDLSQNLLSLILQNVNSNRITVQDFKTFAKLKPKYMQRIIIQISQRIKQVKVKEKLQQKLYKMVTNQFGSFCQKVDIMDYYG